MKYDFVIKPIHPKEEIHYTYDAPGKSSKQTSKLFRHKKDSTTEKVLQCNACNKIFNHHSVHIQHCVGHNGEKNLECNQYRRPLVMVYTTLNIRELILEGSLMKIGKALTGTHTLPNIRVFTVGRNICMKEA